MNTIEKSIAVIDSGVGGCEIYKTLKLKYPKYFFMVLIDSFNFPYGNKKTAFLKDNLDKLLLLASEFDKVVIACNTLSVLVDKNAKIIEMVDITNDYIKRNKYKKVLLLGTYNTVCNMDKYLVSNALVVDYLVKKIQEEDYNEELEKVFKLINDDFDGIILGCTHLIKVKEQFKKHYKADIISQDELIEL